MIRTEQLYDHLGREGISFYTGVPDSLLKNFLQYVQDHTAGEQHIITANEGLALALASGYYLQSGKLPLVYLQNSGLGNLVNPLSSLADQEMYGVPMILLIGWRGEPGIPDEPQHRKMGAITVPLLEVLGVPVFKLDQQSIDPLQIVSTAIQTAREKQNPVALLLSADIFEKVQYEKTTIPATLSLQRESVIRELIKTLSGDETVICTTGKSGREFDEQNKAAGNKIKKYFLSVGAMGHASHIALGIHLQNPSKTILIDGDGALLMHMGALPTISHFANKNFIHLLINNGCHESVGGQPTEAFRVDCTAIARASGYQHTFLIRNEQELNHWLQNSLSSSDTQFVEIRTNAISRPDLGRPAGDPKDWKNDFMSHLTND
ncbi:MAG: phosphonopyruvate decarboxylase [Chitinophagaceae bacterium]|nr:phosphonopyruvate decarboxylase [Chitinophagaceae bacterium]